MPFAPSVAPDADLRTVRGHLAEAATYALELRSRPADKRGDGYTEDVRSAIDFINEFNVIEEAMTRAARPVDQPSDSHGGRSLGATTERPDTRSLGQRVIDSEGYADWQAGGRRGAYETEVRTIIGSWTTGAYDTNSDAWLPVNSRALYTPSLQRRRAFLRDLLGVEQTGLASFGYMREYTATSTETGAATTSEGSAKAEVVMLFESADAPARKITAWIPITDEMLSDAPTLRGYIDARLEYMIMIREEAQIYNGNGTAPNLQGLKTVTGVQTCAAVSGDFPATIANAIAKVENVDGEADGVACNPIDYWTATGKRYSTQFDNGFGGAGGAPGAAGNITWGLPAVRTRALSSGSAMVASWRLGATVYQREGVTIKLSDSHSDNFVKNITVVRGEERVALPIWRPDFFVDVTVPTS